MCEVNSNGWTVAAAAVALKATVTTQEDAAAAAQVTSFGAMGGGSGCCVALQTTKLRAAQGKQKQKEEKPLAYNAAVEKRCDQRRTKQDAAGELRINDITIHGETNELMDRQRDAESCATQNHGPKSKFEASSGRQTNSLSEQQQQPVGTSDSDATMGVKPDSSSIGTGNIQNIDSDKTRIGSGDFSRSIGGINDNQAPNSNQEPMNLSCQRHRFRRQLEEDQQQVSSGSGGSKRQGRHHKWWLQQAEVAAAANGWSGSGGGATRANDLIDYATYTQLGQKTGHFTGVQLHSADQSADHNGSMSLRLALSEHLAFIERRKQQQEQELLVAAARSSLPVPATYHLTGGSPNNNSNNSSQTQSLGPVANLSSRSFSEPVAQRVNGLEALQLASSLQHNFSAVALRLQQQYSAHLAAGERVAASELTASSRISARGTGSELHAATPSGRMVSARRQLQHQTSAAHSPSLPAHGVTSGVGRRRELRKCRRVYGIEQRGLWCTQCKWKKACSRFCDPIRRQQQLELELNRRQ